jgi:ribonuclease HI
MPLQVHLRQKSAHYWMLCKYLILSDSSSSIGALTSQRISARTHCIIYECEEVLSWLRSWQLKIRLMWISAHIGVPGNYMVDGIAKDGAKNEHWDVIYTHRLNLTFYSNGKAN